MISFRRRTKQWRLTDPPRLPDHRSLARPRPVRAATINVGRYHILSSEVRSPNFSAVQFATKTQAFSPIDWPKSCRGSDARGENMRHHPFARIAVALSVLTPAVGCSNKTTVPEAQKTSGVQQRTEPITATGCLRSGIADGTFVLITVQPQDSAKTANY